MSSVITEALQPPNQWQRFEELCADLWARIWDDPSAQRHGRSGQRQQGVDIYGRPRDSDAYEGVQCKGKDRGYGRPLTIRQLRREVAAAREFSPGLSKFIVATATPTDANLQRAAREISEAHREIGLFDVVVVGWDEILRLLGDHEEVVGKYYARGRFGACVSVERVAEYSSLTRQALAPLILPQVPRRVVREKILPAVARGVSEGRRRLVAVVGPAGYGKSAILAETYDALTEAKDGWVALVRFNDLAMPPEVSSERLEAVLGEALTGTAGSITEIANELRKQRGRGVLLLDTLDLVLTVKLVPVLHALFLRLLEGGTTVVVTCRDQEYGTILSPIEQKLPGFGPWIDHHTVSEFTDEEVIAAASGFAQEQPFPCRGGPETFAGDLLALSAENRSLRDIVHNPLLLALLCELFGQDGRPVPQDLTVSELYEEYWRRNVLGSRKFGAASPIPIAKERICLAAASQAFFASESNLHDTVLRADLGLESTPSVADALGELLSDGVLFETRAGKLRFFHQTFLEYAIARWLGTHGAAKDRRGWLQHLKESARAGLGTHWWPVLRQFLASVEVAEFVKTIGQFALEDRLPFRATVLSLPASLAPPVVLDELLEVALRGGDDYQETLLGVLEVMPSRWANSAMRSVIRLLRCGSRRIATKAAQTAGEYLVRWPDHVGPRFDELAEAIEGRFSDPMTEDADKSRRAELYGWLLQAALAARSAGRHPLMLDCLRHRYQTLGEANRLAVIRLHLQLGTPDDLDMLLRVAQSDPMGPSRELAGAWVDLVERLLPKQLGKAIDDDPGRWSAAIHGKHPLLWSEVYMLAIGRLAGKSPPLLAGCLRELLMGPAERIPRYLPAIRGAVQAGGAPAVASALMLTNTGDLAPGRVAVLQKVLDALVGRLGPEVRGALCEWFHPLAQAHPDLLVSTFWALGWDLPGNEARLEHLLLSADPARRSERVREILLSENPPSGPLLSVLEAVVPRNPRDRMADLALVEICKAQAPTVTGAVERLVDLSGSPRKSVASAASRALSDLAHAKVPIPSATLATLCVSKVEIVRVNALGALECAVQDRGSVGSDVVEFVFEALRNERSDPCLQGLLSLARHWIKSTGLLPPFVVCGLRDLTQRLSVEANVNPGTVRALLVALKSAAQVAEARLPAEFGSWVEPLLQAVDLRKIKDGEGETIDLLAAIARADDAFLSRLVVHGGTMPTQNIRALALAIGRVHRYEAPLLDQLLGSPWCPGEVLDTILRLRKS